MTKLARLEVLQEQIGEMVEKLKMAHYKWACHFFIWPNSFALIGPKVNLSIPLILSYPDQLDYRYCTTKLNKQLRSFKWAILWANYFGPGGSKVKSVHSIDLVMPNLARLEVLQEEIGWTVKKLKMAHFSAHFLFRQNWSMWPINNRESRYRWKKLLWKFGDYGAIGSSHIVITGILG